MELLTVREVCAELRITKPDTVRKMLRTGELKGIKRSSRKWLVDRRDLDTYIEEHRHE